MTGSFARARGALSSVSLAFFFALSCSLPLASAEEENGSSRHTLGYIEKVKIGEQGLVVEAILSPAISSTELGVSNLEIGEKQAPPKNQKAASSPSEKSSSKNEQEREESPGDEEEDEEEEENEKGRVEVLLEERDEVDEEIGDIEEAIRLRKPKKKEKKTEYATFTLRDRLGRTGFFSLPVTEKKKDSVAVRLPICLSNKLIKPEVYLADRDKFAQELRIGRSVLAGRFVVDPSLTHSSTPKCDMDE